MLYKFIKFNSGGYYYLESTAPDVVLYTTHGDRRVMDRETFRRLCQDGDVEVVGNGKTIG